MVLGCLTQYTREDGRLPALLLEARQKLLGYELVPQSVHGRIYRESSAYYIHLYRFING